MQFDPDNHVVKLCAQGMDSEGEGKADEASRLFLQAWNEATNDFDRAIAAHYVARHQNTVADKLTWDETALSFALKVDDDKMKGGLPSLYLNVAKCYEDLKDFDSAKTNYQLALSFSSALLDDGYGKMIKSGIASGIDRVSTAKYT
ncbi:MAG TPA: hypothetical protein VK658_01665 [Chryseolinea sp.]|nr:hypothetical protein [Chryseolinea sp.]